MKVGDLVKAGNPDNSPGIVINIDKDFYGARQAFKTYPAKRGEAVLDTRKPDFISPTKDGIQDRVLVFWPDFEVKFSYEPSSALKVINEL